MATTTLFVLIGLIAALGAAPATGRAAKAPKPARPTSEKADSSKYTVTIPSSKDGSQEKCLFYAPVEAMPDRAGAPVPLLVALHTWSGNLEQGMGYLPHAQQRGWAMVAPNFRGPNRRPEACASDLAVQDVLDAVEYAKQHCRVDESRIYLVGGSGGGHMSLMMAARAPQVWAGVSAWVPISDLAAWHAENRKRGGGYDRSLEASCGGPPGTSQTDKEYRARSPLFILANAKGLALDINAGIHDGHTGSVPISHSLRAFNVLAEANGHPEKQIPEQDIASMTADQKVAASLASERDDDPGRKHAVLFRRAAGPARITLFEGGHDLDTPGAIAWLAQQKKAK